MRIAVNLATRPYIELRPVYSRLRLWMLILALFGGALWFLLHSEQSQAREATARVEAVHSHVQHLEQQEQSYQALMRQPQNASILTQANFLNDLFRHKAFSWTATMTDLETVLPAGVQVQSIEPIVAPNGHVTIRMRVSGGRDRAVDLVRNLEKSKHFASPRLAAESMTAAQGIQNAVQNISANSDVSFDILADYRPLPITGDEDADQKDQTAPQDAPAQTEKKSGLSLTPAPAPAGPSGSRPANRPGTAARRHP
ncbi:PilN domain-containing protein [Paracidobacterium acidisoli]|uniref:Fimbrial assembly protein n=1 Tax=Paracidobacterium acidisoli TaxID=2303751 RepID=A0A372ILI2_9BACT|nr:PilN domain-containing protein [Paracidobacterium acidisoli]MBT9332802.1 PilN domain-containing protein [Paracidobacterium acidisoli]